MTEEELNKHLNALGRQQTPAPNYLAARIEARLPDAAPLDQVLAWLGGAIWRGAAAAMLPLALGLSLGLAYGDNGELAWEDTAIVFADSLEVYDYDEI